MAGPRCYRDRMLAGFFETDVIVVILICALILFGGSQIPKLARNLGKAQKEFKQGLAEGAADDKAETKPEKSETTSDS